MWSIAKFILWLVGLAGDIHFGWAAVKWLLTSGAVAGYATTLVGWGLSFTEYVSGLAPILRWGFYICPFIIVFSLVNHTRQQWPRWRARLRKQGDQELRERCCQMSRELYQFLTDYENDKQRLRRWLDAHPDESKGQQLKGMQEELDYEKQAIDQRFRPRFHGPVARLGNDLERQDWITPEENHSLFQEKDRGFWRHSRTISDIRKMANRLAELCHER